jgi:hypothetical protein
MKRWTAACAALAVILPLLFTACSPEIVPSGWEFLGRREVNFTSDRDAIDISRTAGPLKRLLVIAKMNPVEIFDIKVTFDSGAVFDAANRMRLFVGRDQLFIDLPGEARRVREVRFWYRTLNRAARRAQIWIYGQ